MIFEFLYLIFTDTNAESTEVKIGESCKNSGCKKVDNNFQLLYTGLNFEQNNALI